jgi:hypothetical protein
MRAGADLVAPGSGPHAPERSDGEDGKADDGGRAGGGGDVQALDERVARGIDQHRAELAGQVPGDLDSTTGSVSRGLGRFGRCAPSARPADR